MRKFVTLLTAAALSIGMLAGCSGKAETDAAAAANNIASAAETETEKPETETDA